MTKSIDDEWNDLPEELNLFIDDFARITGSTRGEILKLGNRLLRDLIDRNVSDEDMEHVARSLIGQNLEDEAATLRAHGERRVELMLGDDAALVGDPVDQNIYYKPRIAKQLRKLRRLAHFSPGEAAEAAGITVAILTAYEDRLNPLVPPTFILTRLLFVYGHMKRPQVERKLAGHVWPLGDVPDEIERLLEDLGVTARRRRPPRKKRG